MNIAIKEFIERFYTEDMQEVLTKAFDMFERLNIPSCESFVINLISNLDNSDLEFLPVTVTDYVTGFVINLETQFGFRLQDHDTLPLSTRVDIVRGYVDLEDYIDHEAIIRICETDALDVEKLAEAIQFTTDIGMETLMSYIYSVEEAALFNLQQMHLAHLDAADREAEIPFPAAMPDQIVQIKSYRLYMETLNYTLQSLDIVTEGYAVGLPFHVYWERLKDRLIELPRENYARELIAVLLISIEHWRNPLIAFGQISDQLFEDLNFITEINALSKAILTKFSSFKFENRIK